MPAARKTTTAKKKLTTKKRVQSRRGISKSTSRKSSSRC